MRLDSVLKPGLPPYPYPYLRIVQSSSYMSYCAVISTYRLHLRHYYYLSIRVCSHGVEGIIAIEKYWTSRSLKTVCRLV